MTVYQEIFEVLKLRKEMYDKGEAPEKSYTCYLYSQGVDKICKKIGEEASETIIAAKNNDNDELKNSELLEGGQEAEVCLGETESFLGAGLGAEVGYHIVYQYGRVDRPAGTGG